MWKIDKENLEDMKEYEGEPKATEIENFIREIVKEANDKKEGYNEIEGFLYWKDSEVIIWEDE
jgi:hypothetical protein